MKSQRNCNPDDSCSREPTRVQNLRVLRRHMTFHRLRLRCHPSRRQLANPTTSLEESFLVENLLMEFSWAGRKVSGCHAERRMRLGLRRSSPRTCRNLSGKSLMALGTSVVDPQKSTLRKMAAVMVGGVAAQQRRSRRTGRRRHASLSEMTENLTIPKTGNHGDTVRTLQQRLFLPGRTGKSSVTWKFSNRRAGSEAFQLHLGYDWLALI